jgi:hypothetical protein
MELENIIFSEVSPVQKAKVTCFLSYVKYRPNEKYKQYYEKQFTLRGGHV